jgi:organic radical activating enzyme
MDARKVRAHTILFTEDCPLNCRYCQLKYEDDYGVYQGQTFEEILNKIKKYDEEDTRDNVRTQLTFTG